MRNASPARGGPATLAGSAARHGTATSPWSLLYGAYAWLQFLLVGLLTLVLLLCLPSLRARRALTRWSSRVALALAGMRVRAEGLDALPSPCVVVANHASYLDGVVLNGVMPI